MARVNVEQLALSDGRIKHLARLIGTDVFGALGRLVYVWNQCQERGTYTLPPDQLASITEVEEFAQHLIAAQLGRKQGREVYVCGTDGRIEWLTKARENGKKGGRPKGSRKKNQTVSEEKPSGSAGENPPAPAPAPTPAPALEADCRVATPPLPADGLTALDVVHRALETLAPKLAERVDDTQVSLWLRDINPNPYWIAAVLCQHTKLAEVRSPRYVTTMLQTKHEENALAELSPESIEQYVTHVLNPKRRQMLAEVAAS